MLKPGDIVLLAFPFTEGTGSKKRPALVLLDFGDGDFLASRISTQSTGSAFDVDITGWKAAGLLVPSFARVHKIATLNVELVDRKLGKLTGSDFEKIKIALKQLVDKIN